MSCFVFYCGQEVQKMTLTLILISCFPSPLNMVNEGVPKIDTSPE